MFVLNADVRREFELESRKNGVELKILNPSLADSLFSKLSLLAFE